MHVLLALLGLALSEAPVPRECAAPPSRAESGYWSYIESCGCSQLDPPSRASADHDRFMKACSDWRERQSQAVVSRPQATPECDDPPSRAAEGYWDYIEACGCARLGGSLEGLGRPRPLHEGLRRLARAQPPGRGAAGRRLRPRALAALALRAGRGRLRRA